MSTCSDVASEQVCYIPCNFCNIILAVSVPCSSLFDIVTVRCGHCTHLWSVNMAAAWQTLSWQEIQGPRFSSAEYRIEQASSSRCNVSMSAPLPTAERMLTVNRAPEKRQRVPSAYNQFIREEIQRIKAKNPEISHREAFSTAAKNWAHFPHIHFGLMLETDNSKKLDGVSNNHLMTKAAVWNK